MSTGDHVTVRPMRDDDRDAVIGLCRQSLGWRDGDPNEAFFRWKHEENPSGRSPGWVAESTDGELVGLRVFMRWTFLDRGVRRSAVRAVDTATHPDWQGRGIFTKLTVGALPDLEGSGVDFVFNTPNDKSRPGYLKMGWVSVGRVPVSVRPRSALALVRIVRSRSAAEMWSEPVDAGRDAREVFSDRDQLDSLIQRLAATDQISTERTAAFLQWRYGFEPLRYRVMPIGSDLQSGVVVFRVRRRGEAREATIADVLAPAGTSARRALGRIASQTGADYLIATRSAPRSPITRARSSVESLGRGLLPAPRIGPILTWRTLRHPTVPTISDINLTLGDIELF